MSNLLEQASLVMIPSGYKEDIVYSVIPTSGAGDLTFTRASNGTRIDSNGNVEVVPWNLILQSETFNDSYWNKVNGTITSNAIVAPNGTTTADLFTITNNTAFVEKTIAGTGTLFAFIPNTQYTFSCYFKKGSIDYNFRMLMYDGSTLANSGIVNLTTPASSTASYEDVGNGWYRFYHTFTSSASASNGYFYAVNYDYSTTITSGTNVYLWGAQVVQGSTAKPYFPTTDRLNVPRLTYQNGGGGCPSLLLEKQSTNLITYSEDFLNTAWVKADASISSNSAISPDGTQNADKIIPNTNNASHPVYQVIGTGAVSSVTLFAKPAGYNFVQIYGGNASGTSLRFSVVINLTNGTIDTIDTITSGQVTIDAMINGWYKITVNNFTNFTGGAYFLATAAIPSSGLSRIGGLDIVYAGNGTDGVFVWGAQVEESSYSTSYIPTTSSSATRVADACYKTGISSLIGQTQGTFFIDVDIINPVSPNGNVHLLMVGSASERITMFIGNLGTTINADGLGSGGGFTAITGLLTLGRNKMAVGYANNDVAFYVNGTLIGTRTTATIPSSMSQVDVGGNYTYANYIGSNTYNEVVFFPTRLTNSELAQITGNQNYTINQAYESYGVASESPNCVQP